MKQDFLDAGFAVIDGGHANHPLLDYLKEHYPMVIRDNELDLMQLKTLLGLPIDDKVNGYGLNFIGRNFARAKYQQETDKELVLNTAMSKDIDTTKNLVLKGDNLDGLKILKHYYKGKIKCIYIDPPYNTNGDEFIYPDKFDKEEAEVLGLVDLSEDDFARLDFSFKTKKSHNGWLSFMYPRLLLAQELLSDDGVIFISIDDNEQANLKLLCDDVFGEENVDVMVWRKAGIGRDGKMKNTTTYRKDHEYILVAYKNVKLLNKSLEKPNWVNSYGNPDNDPRGAYKAGSISKKEEASNIESENYYTVISPSGKEFSRQFDFSKQEFDDLDSDNRIYWGKYGDAVPAIKIFENEEREVNTSSIIFNEQKEFYSSLVEDNKINTTSGSNELDDLLDCKDVGKEMRPKPSELIRKLIQISTNKDKNHIVLDFFSGTGTTGQAVMQQNEKDKGNRKFILCQIDEVIDSKKSKKGYKFCLDNNLPSVISSITIERLNRAGESIKADIEQHNAKKDVVESDKKRLPDIGYKVFDTTPAPILTLDEENYQIAFPKEHTNAISRIYHMIFKVGVDEPTQVPTAIIDECMYKLGSNYYITDSHKVSEDVLLDALKDGRVYIDGWTASLDVSLQSQKDKVQIVF